MVSASLAGAFCQLGQLLKQLIRGDIWLSSPFIYRCTFQRSKMLARRWIDDPRMWFQRFRPVVRPLELFPILLAYALMFQNAHDHVTNALLDCGTLVSLQAWACAWTVLAKRPPPPSSFRASRRPSTGASRSGRDVSTSIGSVSVDRGWAPSPGVLVLGC